MIIFNLKTVIIVKKTTSKQIPFFFFFNKKVLPPKTYTQLLYKCIKNFMEHIWWYKSKKKYFLAYCLQQPSYLVKVLSYEIFIPTWIITFFSSAIMVLFLLSEHILCKESIAILKKINFQIFTYLYVFRSPEFFMLFLQWCRYIFVYICVSEHDSI